MYIYHIYISYIYLCEGVSLDCIKNCIKNRIHCTYKTYIFTQRHKNISKSDNVVKYKFCYYICSIKMLILLNLTTHMLTVIRTRAHNWVAQASEMRGQVLKRTNSGPYSTLKDFSQIPRDLTTNLRWNELHLGGYISGKPKRTSDPEPGFLLQIYHLTGPR